MHERPVLTEKRRGNMQLRLASQGQEEKAPVASAKTAHEKGKAPVASAKTAHGKGRYRWLAPKPLTERGVEYFGCG